MRLAQFRVTNFRSVVDSGWVTVDDVTAFIGTNESGKTNLLLPLWKLRPAKEGAIVPLSDMPRKEYSGMRNQKPSPVFVRAIFETNKQEAAQLSKLTLLPPEEFAQIEVSRSFDGRHSVGFPRASPARTAPVASVTDATQGARTALDELELKPEQAGAKAAVLAVLETAEEVTTGLADVSTDVVNQVIAVLAAGGVADPKLEPLIEKAIASLTAVSTSLGQPHPSANDAAGKLALSLAPRFVYYSNYGNLDSEIYLPQVIQNLARTGLGAKEEAKARTLKVLFDFVNLKPDEILELGREFRDPGNPTRVANPDEANAVAAKKKERSILLQSASTKLTKDFRTWWKQGDYRFRFEADGDHFRIWVADERRPEEVELEGRSTGLQWFLSFYLVFLVESSEAHDDAILLLDEPGLSLHPLAQSDLLAFFHSLSKENQLLYTTHSPFLVDADRLDRVRKVFVTEEGATSVTSDLGAGATTSEKGSGYAVHAALGLSVSQSLLIGCTPVLVEGASDQHYLTAIKQVLASHGLLATGKELVFPPCGGAKGIKPVVALLGGKDNVLPFVVLDGDRPGHELGEALRRDLYSTEQEKLLDVSTFAGIAGAEIEDLIPLRMLGKQVDRMFRDHDNSFVDVAKTGVPVVGQIESWAKTEGIILEKGWKVELSKRVKQLLLSKGLERTDPTVDLWAKLFRRFTETAAKP